jgi:hypothetical protein
VFRNRKAGDTRRQRQEAAENLGELNSYGFTTSSSAAEDIQVFVISSAARNLSYDQDHVLTKQKDFSLRSK